IRRRRGHARDGKGDRERLLAVSLERRALLSGMLALELMAALAEAQEQGEKGRAGEHVPADLRVRGEAAREDAEHQAERDEGNVEERDFLQLEAVRDVLDKIERRYGRELPVQVEIGNPERDGHEPDGEGPREAFRNLTARDRTEALHRVNAVRLDVD